MNSDFSRKERKVAYKQLLYNKPQVNNVTKIFFPSGSFRGDSLLKGKKMEIFMGKKSLIQHDIIT